MFLHELHFLLLAPAKQQRRGKAPPLRLSKKSVIASQCAQSRPPLQTRNDRSKTAGYMDPALQGRCVEPPVGDGVPTSRQRGSAALSLRGAQRRGNPFSFLERRIPTPVRAGGQSRPPLQTRNDRSKTAGYMDPALQGRRVEPPVGDGVPTSRQRGSAALSLRGAQRREASALGVLLGMTGVRFIDTLRRGGAKPRLCSLLHNIQQLRRSSSHTSS